MKPCPVHPRRSAQTGDSTVLFGAPVVYNVVTRIRTPVGDFDELIAPGALRSALTGSHAGAVTLVRDHDPKALLARSSAGSLTLRDDPLELSMTARLLTTSLATETWELVRRGDLNGMSFAFTVSSGGASWREQSDTDVPLRVVENVERLFDVSVVTWPAYPQTRVSARTSAVLTNRDYRTRALAHQIAMTSTPRSYGRRCAVPPALAEWCARRPWRVGGHAGVDMRSALATASGRAS